jgi:hypothetical protein
VPHPPAVLALEDPLLQAYAQAWNEIAAEQEAIANDPLRNARRARLREMQGRVSEILADLDETTLEWTSKTLPQVYATGATVGAQQAGGEFVWSQIHQEAVQHLVDRAYTDLLDATRHTEKTTKALVRAVVRDQSLQKMIQGRTAVDAGRRMQTILEKKGIHSVVYKDGTRHGLREYGQMVARTVSATAYNEGTLNAGHSLGVKFWEVFDGPGCGWTAHGSGEEANGKIVTREEALAWPISHPNAVMAGTSVSVLGVAKGAYAARWNGPVVRLTSLGGRRLTVGPNHPVLTTRGWVRADELSEGDHVVCETRSSSRLSVEEDINDRPPFVQEVFEALRSFGVNSRVRPSPMQFHGDGNFCEGEVDVVYVNGELSVESNMALQEKLGQLVFYDADPNHLLVSGLRPLPPSFDRIDLPSSSIVRSRHVPGVGSPVPDVDPGAGEYSLDSTGRSLENLADLGHALSCGVELDRLVLVERYSWSGHAYDLETSTGMYVADGIIVHNCRRAFGARPDLEEAAPSSEAPAVPEEVVDTGRLERRGATPTDRVEARAEKLAAREEARVQTWVPEPAGGAPRGMGDPLPVEEDKAWAAYAQNSFKINSDLRKGEMPEAVDVLDQVFKRSYTPEQTTVYRMIDDEKFYKKMSGHKPGRNMNLTDNSYMSTSLSKEVVEDFSLGDFPVRLDIEVAKGTPSFYVGDRYESRAIMMDQKELVLPRGAKVQVYSTSKMSDGTIVAKARIEGFAPLRPAPK